MYENVPATSGSDLTIQFAFTDGATPPAALAITTPVILEETGGLEGRCTMTITDAANGLAQVFIEGTTPIAIGAYFLRVQVLLTDSSSLSSERVLVNVQ
jgi:hypothetical protein